MVGYHYYGSAINGHVLKAYDVLLTEIEARVDILQICSKRLKKERVISGCSFLLHKLVFSFVGSTLCTTSKVVVL